MNPSDWRGHDLVAALVYSTPRDDEGDESRTVALNNSVMNGRLILPTGIIHGGLSPQTIAASVIRKQIHMNAPESEMELTFTTDMFSRFGRVHLIRVESKSRISFQDQGHRRCVRVATLFSERVALLRWQKQLVQAAMEAVPVPA